MIARESARLSAEVTHAHPEGAAGAIATAVAAACAWRRREDPRGPGDGVLLAPAIQRTPEGRLARHRAELPAGTSVAVQYP